MDSMPRKQCENEMTARPPDCPTNCRRTHNPELCRKKDKEIPLFLSWLYFLISKRPISHSHIHTHAQPNPSPTSWPLGVRWGCRWIAPPLPERGHPHPQQVRWLVDCEGFTQAEGLRLLLVIRQAVTSEWAMATECWPNDQLTFKTVAVGLNFISVALCECGFQVVKRFNPLHCNGSILSLHWFH